MSQRETLVPIEWTSVPPISSLCSSGDMSGGVNIDAFDDMQSFKIGLYFRLPIFNNLAPTPTHDRI